MADVRKHVRVFLASPGDLSEERKLAKSAVDEFNGLFSESYGYQVDLVGWEDTVSVFGRPQELINGDLARCELFVGVVWKKWGTPPSVNGPYTSGFEEEFRVSLEKRKNSGVPEMSMFFKGVSDDLLRDPGDQLKKVLAFRDELIDGKFILFQTFLEPRDFERKFFRCIATYVKKIVDAEKDRVADEAQSSKVAPAESVITKSKKGQSPLSPEGAGFARSFLALCEENNGVEIADADIARFRLLGTLLKGGGNDLQHLGVHDANVLYKDCDTGSLGSVERYGLLRAGLASLKQENIPLWRWLVSVGGNDGEVLIYLSISDDPEVQHGALTVMRLMEYSISSEFNRSDLLAYWLGGSRSAGSRVAAIKYLSVCGQECDIDLLRAEFDTNNGQTAYAAAEAIVRISMQNGRSSAISSLYELRPTSVSQGLIDCLFGIEPEALAEDLILRGLAQPNAEVRFAVANISYKRSMFSVGQSEELLVDEEPRIRYLAMKHLQNEGRDFSEKDAEEILKKPAQTSNLLGSNTSSDLIGSFKGLILRRCTDQELEAKAKTESAFGYDANIALVERNFKERGAELREWIDDGFRGIFAQGLESLSKLYRDEKFLSDVKRLEGYITRGNARAALDVLHRFSDSSDLNRVRRALRDGLVDATSVDIEFLGKFGDWEDVKLVLKISGESSSLGNLLIPKASAKNETICRCLLKLGRHRVYDLLTMQMPDSIRVRLASLLPASALESLSDGQISSLFLIESDAFRRTVAIKCVLSLAKRRSVSILNLYVSGDGFRFYNVIFWLDLAASFSKKVASKIAVRALVEI
jgi:hypothetical protein